MRVATSATRRSITKALISSSAAIKRATVLMRCPTKCAFTLDTATGIASTTAATFSTMAFIRSFDKMMMFLCLCVLYTMLADCRPLSQRSISEVQLMHSVGFRKHVQQRQEWLESHMQDIHTAPQHDGKIGGERNPLPLLSSGDITTILHATPRLVG